MGISIYNIKKWSKMLTGNSIMHVNQNMGQSFIPGKIEGYFNNLTEKVLKDQNTLRRQEVPITTDEVAGKVHFPIAIFQYGLGAYDLFLQTKEECYLVQFWNCVNWAIANQKNNGSWNNFGFVCPDAPYSSMCQGEGVSLLARAYIVEKNEFILKAAKKAIDFMLLPVEKGGTAKYIEDDLILLEYTNKACVLNGWIFSIFGLYDYVLMTGEKKYKELLDKSIQTLESHIEEFDGGYWSMYDSEGIISSPFYHNLHIAQLEALELVFKNSTFERYKNKFVEYKNNNWNYRKAFIKKVVQKLMEK
ncbi:D-glucuronyl C5-epimerase C-terminus [Eubacterium aggregans]|uniref:D-glucuronyl C5-epimerase C-terminus n=2 Tax=Eubacterium aggregans TaxID=81409 RepID=A0A1H3Y8S3_9FIRM|nr:D-glucuronyl C5-epimerase C-terminus [Eubacterium aggregans]